MRSLLSDVRRCAVWSSIVPWACAGLFCVTATTGCASGPQTPDTGENKKEKKREPQAPSPEELASSPCGNPKWGSLPEEHAIDGDPAPSDKSDSDTDAADTKDGSKANTKTDAHDGTDGPVHDKQNEEGGDEQ